jgi:hypothetical protein
MITKDKKTRPVGERPPQGIILKISSIGAPTEKGHESWSPVQHEGPPSIDRIFTRALSPPSLYTRIRPP